jgi:hypothetical protein
MYLFNEHICGDEVVPLGRRCEYGTIIADTRGQA